MSKQDSVWLNPNIDPRDHYSRTLAKLAKQRGINEKITVKFGDGHTNVAKFNPPAKIIKMIDVDVCNDKIRGLMAKIAELKKVRSEKEAEIERLNAEQVKLNTNITRLEAIARAHDQLNRDKAQVEQALAKLQGEHTVLTGERDDWKRRHEEQIESFKQLNLKKQDVEAKLQQTEAAFARIKEEHGLHATTITILKRELAEEKDKVAVVMNANKKTVDELTQQISSCNLEISKLRAENANEKKKHQQELASLNAETQRLQAILDQSQKKHGELFQKHDELVRKHKEVEQNLANVHQQKFELQQELTKSADRLSKLQLEISKLGAENANEKKKHQQELASSNAETQRLQAILDQSQKKHGELFQKHDELVRKHKEVEQNLANVYQQKFELQQELTKSADRLSKLHTENIQITENLLELNRKNADVKKLSLEKDRDLERCRTEIVGLKEELEQLRLLVESLKDINAELEQNRRKIQSLTDKLKNEQGNNRDLKEQLDRNIKEHKEKEAELINEKGALKAELGGQLENMNVQWNEALVSLQSCKYNLAIAQKKNEKTIKDLQARNQRELSELKNLNMQLNGKNDNLKGDNQKISAELITKTADINRITEELSVMKKDAEHMAVWLKYIDQDPLQEQDSKDMKKTDSQKPSTLTYFESVQSVYKKYLPKFSPK